MQWMLYTLYGGKLYKAFDCFDPVILSYFFKSSQLLGPNMRLAVPEYNTFTFADGTLYSHCHQAQECCENLEGDTFIKVNGLVQNFEENKLRLYWLRHRPFID